MGTSLFNTTPANTYPALIKVGDNSTIDGTLKTLSDGAGNDLPIQVSSTVVNLTGKVGIGTPANDYGLLALNGTLNFPKNYLNGAIPEPNIFITTQTQPDPNNFAVQNFFTLSIGTTYVQNGVEPFNTGYGNTYAGLGSSAIGADNSYFNTMIGYASSITVPEPGNVVIGYGATSSTASATVIGRQTNVSGFQGTAIGFQAQTTTTNGFALGNSSALLQIGGNFTPTARVHVRGLGSTSATTSLLVQNSAATESMTFTDDGVLTVANPSNTGAPKIRVGTSGFNNDFNQLRLYAAGNLALAIQSNSIAFTGSGAYAQMSWVTNTSLSLSTNDSQVFMNAQGTSFGKGSGAATSSIVEITSTTKGFLPPRMTTVQRDAIATPATGLRIYNTTTNTNDTYNGTVWQSNSVSGVAGAIQFSNGSAFASDAANLFWDDTNKRLGVGTNAPIDTINSKGVIRASRTDDTNSHLTMSAEGGFGKIIAYGGIGVHLNETTTTVLQVLSGNVTIGNGTTGLSAKVGIKGSGSTSATTSLLVQNSAGTQSLKIADDLWFQIGSMGGAGTGQGIRTDSGGGGINGGINTNFNNGATWNDDTNVCALKIAYNNGIRIANTTRYPLTLGSDTKAVASAQLEMVSTSQGFLPPRMTTAQRVAISSPANGLIVFDTDVQNLCYRRDSTWVQVSFTAV